MNLKAAALISLSVVAVSFAAKIAVFPMQGVNTDQSFADAFALLLAGKYETISGNQTISPSKAGKAIGPDSSLVEAARQLGADEYLEITAIGLYISRKEQNSTPIPQRIEVSVKTNDGDDDDRDNDRQDQEKLDNSKTVVTVVRRKADGSQIFRSELTLLTYGDIEEGTQRFAASLFKKVPINDTRTIDNITRKEGMGKNRLFVGKHKGVKVGMMYVTTIDSIISPFVTIGFNYKLDADRYFLELGVGGRFPSELNETGNRHYGGVSLEIGGSYFALNNVLSIYTGGGINPFIDVLNNGMQMGIAPYLQAGFMIPRNSRVLFYGELRIAQNVMPITTGQTTDTTGYVYPRDIYPTKHKSYPTEIGVAFGIGF